MPATFSLALPPDWEQTKDVWAICMQQFAERGLQQDSVHALSMVAQELTENAVKYGQFSQPTARIMVAVWVRRDVVTIQVSNPVAPESARLKELDLNIQWIRGFQAPFEAFVARLKAASMPPFAAGESGLGLVRIAYEGRAVLDFYVDESNVLAVSAVHHLAEGA